MDIIRSNSNPANRRSPSASSGSPSDTADFDLQMAERDYKHRRAGIQGEAYRQALSEIAGEIYVGVYKQSLAAAVARQQQLWEEEAGPSSSSGATPAVTHD